MDCERETDFKIEIIVFTQVKCMSFLSHTDTLSTTTPNVWPHQIDVHVQQTSLTNLHTLSNNTKLWCKFSFTLYTLSSTTPNFWPHQIDVHFMYNKPHLLTDTLSPTTPNCDHTKLRVQQTKVHRDHTNWHTLYNHTECLTTPNWCTFYVQQTSLTDWHTLSNNTKLWYEFSFTLYTLYPTTPNFWPHQIDVHVKRTSLTDWHTLSNHTKLWPHQMIKIFPSTFTTHWVSVHVQILN